MPNSTRVKLGLGLIGIGRRWGYQPGPIPSERETREFLNHAFLSGITVFDTAPSYGISEQRLSRFLSGLDADERLEITVATKCGEHWDSELTAPYVDHSYEALCKSIDRSLTLLGKIDLLQIHKATPEVIASHDIDRALAYARRCGISKFGVSISDAPTGLVVCRDARFSTLQLPFNTARTSLADVIIEANRTGKYVLVNRPFQSGEYLAAATTPQKADQRGIEAFRFILDHQFDGCILTGTTSLAHLQQNLVAYRQACALQTSGAEQV